jgi:hypothetical protein
LVLEIARTTTPTRCRQGDLSNALHLLNIHLRQNAKLKSTVHHTASQEAVWLCCEFEKRLMGLRSGGSSVDQLDTLDLHCIAMCLAGLGCNAENVCAKKRNNLQQLENVYQMTSMAGRLLSDWPISFHSALQKLYARIVTSKRNSAARYADRLRMNIYERLSSPAFDFVRLELDRPSPDPNCAPGDYKHHPMPVMPRQLTDLKTISKAININAPLLKRLIAEGELHGCRGLSACGNKTIVADLKQAQHLATNLSSLMNIEQAANHLKLPINTMKMLCKNDFFTCRGGKPAAGQSWWIDQASFDMSSVFLKRQRSIESTISLRDVLQHPFISQEGVVPLFQAIQAGALSVSIIGKSDLGVLGEWRLGKEEWRKWLHAHMDQLVSSQSLSVLQAAKVLSITQDVAYALIRYGLLNSTVELRNGVKSHRITLHAIEQFKELYILGKEIAKTLRTTSEKVADHMRKLGIAPIAGPSSSSFYCRQYIWSKGPCFEMMISWSRK